MNLVPENSDRAASMLCIAGSWLKKRGPNAADRLYKLLVRRCGKTELGKEADRIRWFPKIEKTSLHDRLSSDRRHPTVILHLGVSTSRGDAPGS